MSDIEPAEGVRIHFETSGEGTPVLLIGPGTVSDHGSGEPETAALAGPLSSRFRVVAVDQRHTGRSQAPAEPFSYEQAVADHLAVLDELGIDKAHVVAAGVDCAQAWRLAQDAPDRVRTVVCLRPAGRDGGSPLGAFHRPFDEAMRVARAEGLAGVLAQAQRDGSFGRSHGAGPFAQRLHDDEGFRTELAKLSVERYIVLVGRFRDGLFPGGSPWFSVPEESMRSFPVPLTVVPGSDATRPEGVAKRICQEAPEAYLAEPGAGPVADFLTRNS